MSTRRQVLRLAGTAAIAAAAPRASAQASPLRIGFGMALTGALAVNGKPALLAMQIWQEEVNAKGGLLGRKVELVYFDDQSNPSSVPGIYAKLLDVDKVDLIVSGYATNMVAPLMPTAIERGLMVLGLFSLASNAEFHYPNYFSMLPAGPQPKIELSRGFFEIALAQEPKPGTVAMISADAEFSHRAAEGARENAKAAGLKIIYDRTYPPSNVDFGPVLRGVQAANADIVYVASYPADSVGIVRAAHELRLTAKQFGGSLVGLQSTTLRMQLGPLLNGIVASDYWVPTPALMFPGIAEFLAKYQARAAGAGVDPLGYFIPPFAYARMQVLAQAVEATGSLDQAKLAAYLRANAVRTIVGNFAFGRDGEWIKPRYLFIQYRGIKDNSLEQFRQAATYVVLHPQEYSSGATAIPYDKAR
jgi:branched-chain amino acid transport system substrate-binding protein